MNDYRAKDINVFKLGKKFLLDLPYPEINEELISEYLKEPEREDSMKGIFKKILFAAQEAERRQNVLEKHIGKLDHLLAVLEGFNPIAVVKKYYKDRSQSVESHWMFLFDDMISTLNISLDEVSSKESGMIPQYSKTILSVAQFLARFKSSDDFYSWVEKWDEFTQNDIRNRTALPLVLESKLHGFGFALSCNMLKDLGFATFAKPDTHMQEIFQKTGLCIKDANEYEVFMAIIRMARHVEETPYAVDKLFWLIGSGYFHDHPQIGKKGRIGRKKEKFIRYISERIV